MHRECIMLVLSHQGLKNKIEWFLYDLEMKTHEQNRNNKWTEIGRFDWFIEKIQTCMAFGWKNFKTKKFLEINQYFALMTFCSTIGQSNNAFSISGFSLAGKGRAMFWSFHTWADKTNNKHLPKPFFKVMRKSPYLVLQALMRQNKHDTCTVVSAS